MPLSSPALSALSAAAELNKRPTLETLWGLRRREAVEAQAQAAGLWPAARHALPAHNLLPD